MSSTLTRRDFIKLAAGASLAPLLGNLPVALGSTMHQENQLPNIIIILFDALAAGNLSIYGYPRNTCTNLERLAKRSIVYHRHHSAGNFTAPSTASLFTGTYPWGHRVFTLNGIIHPDIRPFNLFDLLPKQYNQIVWGHNMYADMLLHQFQHRFYRHLGPESGSLVGRPFYNRFFPNDAIYGAKIFDQFLFDPKEKPGSLYLSLPVDIHRQFKKASTLNQMFDAYPEGLPFIDGAETFFTIDALMKITAEMLTTLPAPFFAYLHYLPPHAPYRPSREYLNLFNDGWAPRTKKYHRLSTRRSPEDINKLRQKYDEYIANLDAEFGSLLDALEKSGLLDSSYLIVMSDHGDFFERGQQGHITPLLFEAVTHIPLLISTPGQRERRDIHALTSNIDLMPTLLKMTGQAIPESCEGRPLPGLGGEELEEREIYSLEAKKNHSYSRLSKATVAMWKGQYKLIQYMGYKGFQGYELYDLERDPGELFNQYESHPAAREMQAMMDKAIQQVDEPYVS